MPTLIERLASLRESTDQSTRSEDNSATPLWAFLYLYSCSHKESYEDNMKGARSLYAYLSPISFPVQEIPAIEDKFTVPAPLAHWEIDQLAKVLTEYPERLRRMQDMNELDYDIAMDSVLAELRRAERAILLTTVKQVLPLLY